MLRNLDGRQFESDLVFSRAHSSWLVEQRSHKALVAGSTPAGPTIKSMFKAILNLLKPKTAVVKEPERLERPFCWKCCHSKIAWEDNSFVNMTCELHPRIKKYEHAILWCPILPSNRHVKPDAVIEQIRALRDQRDGRMSKGRAHA